jgi:hypothetical protein
MSCPFALQLEAIAPQLVVLLATGAEAVDDRLCECGSPICTRQLGPVCVLLLAHLARSPPGRPLCVEHGAAGLGHTKGNQLQPPHQPLEWTQVLLPKARVAGISELRWRLVVVPGCAGLPAAQELALEFCNLSNAGLQARVGQS